MASPAGYSAVALKALAAQVFFKWSEETLYDAQSGEGGCRHVLGRHDCGVHTRAERGGACEKPVRWQILPMQGNARSSREPWKWGPGEPQKIRGLRVAQKIEEAAWQSAQLTGSGEPWSARC